MEYGVYGGFNESMYRKLVDIDWTNTYPTLNMNDLFAKWVDFKSNILIEGSVAESVGASENTSNVYF